MTPDPPFKIPWVDRSVIFEEAEAIVRRLHPKMTAPVPIEAIVEGAYGFTIVPAEHLTKTLRYPSFTSWVEKQVWVDLSMLQREPGWYHFTLAHELGHVVLHTEVFQASDHRTRADYERFRSRFNDDNYSTMEQQANLFAGAFLAPRPMLTQVLDECVGLARKSGVRLPKLVDDVEWPVVFRAVARRLEVNDETIPYRFDALGLIHKYR